MFYIPQIKYKQKKLCCVFIFQVLKSKCNLAELMRSHEKNIGQDGEYPLYLLPPKFLMPPTG